MSYGTLAYADGKWLVTATPHVMTRIKRMFPRMKQQVAGAAMLQHTAEVARDLEWMLQRWPLAVSEKSLTRLTEAAEHHRQTEVRVRSIITGDYHRPEGMREPALPARAYQQQAADIVLATGNLLLIDSVGLGKTLSGLLTLCHPEALPALVVTLTHLPRQWKREIEKFLPWLSVSIPNKGRPYPLGSPLFGEPDVIILNYAKLGMGWGHHLEGHVRSVIFDEIHELRNMGKSEHEPTDKYAQAAIVAHAAQYRMGLSATPVFNYAGDIYNIFSILAPDCLGTREEFRREWEAYNMGAGGHLAVRAPEALRAHLLDQGLMLHRTRKDVNREIPEPQLIEWPIDTNHDLLNSLAGDIYTMAEQVLNGTREQRFTAGGQLDSALRAATGIAKAPFVAEFVRFLLESEEKIILFGHHHAVYDIWRKALADFNPVSYTGEESSSEKARSLERFLDGDSRLFLMANRSGAGLDGLQRVCSVVVFGELDWSPAIHTQAVGRVHRDDQESTVVAYFCVSEGGTDPLMAERLELKRQQADPIQNPQAGAFQSLEQEQHHIRELARRLLARRAA